MSGFPFDNTECGLRRRLDTWSPRQPLAASPMSTTNKAPHSFHGVCFSNRLREAPVAEFITAPTLCTNRPSRAKRGPDAASSIIGAAIA